MSITNEQNQASMANNHINEIEKVLNASSLYVSIGSGEKRILQFLPQKRITEVEKIYNDQKVKKIRFIVIDPNSESNAEKHFDVGKRSARLILEKLKEGHTLLKIERIGAGKETLYIPTEVSKTE
jgi:hypothetical protein